MLYREGTPTDINSKKGSTMCTGGDPGGGTGGGGGSTPKPKPKAKPKAAPNFGAPKSSQRPTSSPKAAPKAAPSTGGGASRRAAPTGEEFRAKRAPGQPDVKLPSDRRGRPKEPGGVDDRAPKKTAAQTSFDSIQELRGRLDNPLLPGTAGAVLGSIGRVSLKSQIKALQEGAIPVIADGMTVGTITKGGSYTGRPEYGDIARENYKKGGASIDTSMREAAARQRAAERDRGPDEPKSDPAPKPEPVEEVTQMGGGTLTTKRRRGSGRRTAFGTRQSLVNLRNV